MRSIFTYLQSVFGIFPVQFRVIIALIFQTSIAQGQNIFFNKVDPPLGKPFIHVTGIVQDKQGYMWFASKNGLFRYDGYTIKQYRSDPLNPNSLRSDALECICIDKNGIIWIGSFNAGLERFDPVKETFTHFRHDARNPASINSDTVDVVFSDSRGTLWVGASSLDRLDEKTNSFIHFRHNESDKNSISSNEVRAIYEDRKGVLWIGTGSVYKRSTDTEDEGGLNKMNRSRGNFTVYKNDPNDTQSLSSNKVRALFEDSKGNFWVGTAGDGLHIMNRATGKFQRFPYDPNHPEKLSRPPVKKAPFYDHITFITEDTTGAIWIGTAESGINYYDPIHRRITHYERQKEIQGAFSDYTAWWAYRSREGVLWISSTHGSLYRINPSQGSVPFFAVKGRGATAFYTASDHTLWIGTDSGLIEKDAYGRILKDWKNDPANRNSLPFNDVSCITADRSGRLWIGSFGGAISQLDRETGKASQYHYDTAGRNSNGRSPILSFYPAPDSTNILWVCTFRGLDRVNTRTNHYRHYLFYPGDEREFGPNAVTCVLKDSQSKWWAGSWERGGVHRFDPATGKSKTYLDGANIVSIKEDHEHTLWAACREGLFRFDRAKDVFIRFDDLGFLSEANEIRGMEEDANGYLWLTTLQGIVRVSPGRDVSMLFGRSYGINGTDFFYLAAGKNSDGKLFFGAQSGYYCFYPGEIIQKKRPPEILLTAFKISNRAVQPGEGSALKSPLSSITEILLEHDQNIFSFDFVGIDYSNPEENRHFFMLENYDAAWNLAGAERSAIYFNVPPGNYVFRVKVVNSFGVWAERSIRIVILPPWWSTWWFRIGSVVLIIALFYAVIRWRVKQKFNRQLEQSEKDKQLAELRQKTGELEMQALRAQMNPHFVFNSLNAINRFILENNKNLASEYLTKFSRLVRMILQNSQSALITLESELESLQLYLELESMRFDHRFDYHLSVADTIDKDIIKVPPLIIQPYAENAIWHGLMHKEERGSLEIEVAKVGYHLMIRIKDDGIGRKQAAAMTSKSATRHKSLGLKITADRIAMLQNHSSVIVKDLVGADGNAAGTEVILKIPFIYD